MWQTDQIREFSTKVFILNSQYLSNAEEIKALKQIQRPHVAMRTPNQTATATKLVYV